MNQQLYTPLGQVLIHVFPHIFFHDKKSSVELVKRDEFHWIFGSVTPFGKTLPPSFRSMFKPILGYTGLIRKTFNTMRDEDCAAFTVCVGTTILECEDFYLGMRFFNVNHDVFNGTSGNN